MSYVTTWSPFHPVDRVIGHCSEFLRRSDHSVESEESEEERRQRELEMWYRDHVLSAQYTQLLQEGSVVRFGKRSERKRQLDPSDWSISSVRAIERASIKRDLEVKRSAHTIQTHSTTPQRPAPTYDAAYRTSKNRSIVHKLHRTFGSPPPTGLDDGTPFRELTGVHLDLLDRIHEHTRKWHKHTRFPSKDVGFSK